MWYVEERKRKKRIKKCAFRYKPFLFFTYCANSMDMLVPRGQLNDTRSESHVVFWNVRNVPDNNAILRHKPETRIRKRNNNKQTNKNKWKNIRITLCIEYIVRLFDFKLFEHVFFYLIHSLLCLPIELDGVRGPKLLAFYNNQSLFYFIFLFFSTFLALNYLTTNNDFIAFSLERDVLKGFLFVFEWFSLNL